MLKLSYEEIATFMKNISKVYQITARKNFNCSLSLYMVEIGLKMWLMRARFAASNRTSLFTQKLDVDLWNSLLGMLWMQEVFLYAREDLKNM